MDTVALPLLVDLVWRTEPKDELRGVLCHYRLRAHQVVDPGATTFDDLMPVDLVSKRLAVDSECVLNT